MKLLQTCLIILIVLSSDVRAWNISSEEYRRVASISAGALVLGVGVGACLSKKAPVVFGDKSAAQLEALLKALHVSSPQEALEKIARADEDLKNLQVLLEMCGEASNSGEACTYLETQVRTLVDHTLSVLKTVSVYLGDIDLDQTVEQIRSVPDELWDAQTIEALKVDIARVIQQRNSLVIASRQESYEQYSAMSTFFGPNSNVLNDMIKARNAGQSAEQVIKLLPEKLDYKPSPLLPDNSEKQSIPPQPATCPPALA